MSDIGHGKFPHGIDATSRTNPMSIHTGKDGYDSLTMWTERSAKALADKSGPLYAYDANTGYDETVPWLRGKLAAMNKPRVLEIGSGFGRWAGVLRDLYGSFTGVDVVPSRVKHAQELYPDVKFRLIEQGKPWDLGERFDVVMSITVIQHVTLPLAEDIVRHIAQHLRVGGVALLAEGRLWDIDEAEAEARYADGKTAAHMIPKPISALRAAAPELAWTIEGGGKFTLTR